MLFACVNVSRRLNVDPELALRQATQRFVARIERAEALAVRDGQDWARLDLEGQDRYFDRAKEEGPVSAIAAVRARQIFDSRGNPAVEVDVVLDSGCARPGGSSLGSVDRAL